MITSLLTIQRILKADEERYVRQVAQQVRWTPGMTAEQLHRRIALDGVMYGINATRRRLRELADKGLVEERDGLWFAVETSRRAA